MSDEVRNLPTAGTCIKDASVIKSYTSITGGGGGVLTKDSLQAQSKSVPVTSGQLVSE